MPDDQPVKLRIGLHTGPCVSGLVGLDVPKWSVFGDTVNTAARLEQTAVPTTIQISNATKSLLPSLDLKLVHNGAVAMKVGAVQGCRGTRQGCKSTRQQCKDTRKGCKSTRKGCKSTR
eukprot:scaffold122110_cov21-Tisochrysis_lutea.AAC.3